MDHNTVFGGFRVARDGVQIAHKRVLVQGQDGKEGDRLAGGTGAGQAALPDAAVESTPVS